MKKKAKKVVKKVAKKATTERQGASSGVEVIEFGKGKDMEVEGWAGTVKKKIVPRIEGLKRLDRIHDLIAENQVKGSLAMVDLICELYPEIDLKYGKHQFTSVEQLFDSKQGEQLINSKLVGALAGTTVDLSKN
jgi:hypothetical protein